MKIYLLWIDLLVCTSLALVIAVRCKHLCHHSIPGRIGYQLAVLGLSALALRTILRLVHGAYGDVSEGHIFSLLSRVGFLIAFLAAGVPGQNDARDQKDADTKEQGCVHDETTPEDGTLIPDFRAINIPEFHS